jgi:hypothetical protein
VRSEAKVEALQAPDVGNPLVYERGADGVIVGVEEDVGERVGGKEEGLRRWKDVMGRKFLRGEDREFDYGVVDEGEEFDDIEEEARGAQEDWFEGEEQAFVGDGHARGETGVQDFKTGRISLTVCEAKPNWEMIHHDHKQEIAVGARYCGIITEPIKSPNIDVTNNHQTCVLPLSSASICPKTAESPPYRIVTGCCSSSILHS